MGSTAGGFKISRVTALFQIGRNELRRSLNPRRVSSVRLNGRALSAQEQQGMLSYLALYLGVLIAVFLLISFEPMGMETNLASAVSCVNNIGPGAGATGPAGSYAAYTAFSKIVLSFAMLMGRLEIYPLLALAVPRR